MVLSTTSATTACEIWHHLELVYHSRDTMSMMTASSRFYSLKIREGEPVDQFVSKFISLRLRLAQNGTI